MLPARGEFPQPPDPPDGLGVEPPSAVGLSGKDDRLPGHLVQHHAVAVRAIGDSVERDGLAIQDELELMGQQAPRLARASRGRGRSGRGSRWHWRSDRASDHSQRWRSKRSPVSFAASCDRSIARRRRASGPKRGPLAAMPWPQEPVPVPCRQTSESEDDDREPKHEMEHGRLPCLATRRTAGREPRSIEFGSRSVPTWGSNRILVSRFVSSRILRRRSGSLEKISRRSGSLSPFRRAAFWRWSWHVFERTSRQG